DGSVETASAQGLGIQYRCSEARRRGDIILAAEMGPFEMRDAEELLEACKRIRADREGKHPGRNLPSAGSFFKNLPPTEPGGRRTPAGKVLEEAGAKSLRFGDAGVFEKHANIIVNYGRATARDVNQLADEMARLVQEKFGIILEREVQYLC
ncbi:MAG: UDP-N-acetylmuramate dehydrogenase, partial [Candidatus Hinthialibacter sp.]